MSAFTRVLPFCAFSLCLAIALLTTPVWAQTYVSGTLGFASYSSDAGGNDGSGMALGVEVGKDPDGSGFGYSLGYQQDPQGDDSSSTIDLGLMYVPGDGGLWFDTSLGTLSGDANSATVLTVGVYREFAGIMAGSPFVPYGGIGLRYDSLDIEDTTIRVLTVTTTTSCEADSSINPVLEAGAKNAMSDTSEIKIALSYFTSGGDVECTRTPSTGMASTSTSDWGSSAMQVLITYKRWF